MKSCLIIPFYNHQAAIPLLLAKLQPLGLPCLLINDGSSVPCSKVLRDCTQQHAAWLTLIERPQNGGKGAAVIDGFKQAIALGYSHAIQIDADGQHDVADIPRMLQRSQNQPAAMILGKPQYAADAPKSRVYGRQFTNLWIYINTLSFAIADGMCGLRVYPLTAVVELLKSSALAKGMAFDIDIVVRLYWLGTPAINHPTQVSYPLDGVSHFDMWRDNLQISKTHARLFFGMLPRIPKLLYRHFR
ncbi:MAG: glycosyl transferase [Methylomonas sp.]|nr:MAG: glycosyl transferase [Methylomonas sp.]